MTEGGLQGTGDEVGLRGFCSSEGLKWDLKVGLEKGFEKLDMHILIYAGASKLPVGVSENGVWVVQMQNVAIPLTAKASPGVVALLEYARADLRQQLLKALERHSLPKTLLDSFPRVEVIRAGLGWSNAYWQQKALDWLEDSDWTAVTDLLLFLETQGATQKIRHSARAKLNRGNLRNLTTL